MKNNPDAKKAKPLSKKTILICVVAFLALVLIGMIVAVFVLNNQPEEPTPTIEPTAAPTAPPTEAPTEVTEAPTEPEETEPQPIDWMVALKEQNPDIVYWMKIEGTKLDYPVMYTPDEPERYIHKDFEGNYSPGGVPFMEDACSVELGNESDNLIVYGHNMVDGSQFRVMMDYKKKEFWEENPHIILTDMYNESTFEIFSVFYDRVYYQSETNVFKFYRFIEPKTEEEFNTGIAYFKNNALYDTGITPEYGDQLLMLVTCSYHTKLGRFVMVAREIVEEPAVN